MKPVLNIAHRGASAYAPENTFAAYDLARSLGADAIELDVQQTFDGELVVIHDDTVTRTTRGADLLSDAVNELVWSDISSRDSGSWFNELKPQLARAEYTAASVPRLADVFERYGASLTYFIELKHPPCRTGMEMEIADLVHRYGLLGDNDRGPIVLVAAFSQPCLKRLRHIEERLALVQLFHAYATPSSIRAYLGALPDYCRAAGPHKDAIDGSLVEVARLHGLETYTWTANDTEQMKELIRLGVGGIITDFPEKLTGLMSEGVGHSGQGSRMRTRI